ncbi:MAG: MBL fold metallo-hydrolase [Actinobacteria bacterium]|nr:MBL fold metallo-hydrolase [Actinomycetota bacterium]
MTLSYRVFIHSYEGWNSTSTLFYGERDAVLVDACQLLSDAHRLAADLILMGKNLTHIYVSHFHPDHHFGAGVLQFAFPRAQVVGLPSVVRDIASTTDDKIIMWGDVFGANEPDRVTIPTSLPEAHLEVEGQSLQFSDGWEGDCQNNSVVWAPSLGVLCATDVAELDSHVWTAESDTTRRSKWKAALRKLRDFGAGVVIPGHCSPEVFQQLTSTGWQGDACIDFTLGYLDAYEDVLSRAKTGEELVAGMEGLYPGMKTENFGLQWQARLLFPKSCPDWFAKLPGEPGKIFLDPTGKYIGEPPRE